MAQITSRGALEEWLKGKPADWAQVIAARAALRVVPYAFDERTSAKGIGQHSLSLFRATAISWAARNFPTYDMILAAIHADAAARATYATHVSDAVDAAARAAYATHVTNTIITNDNALDATTYAARAVDEPYTIWENVTADCDWLDDSNEDTDAARHLTRERLWMRSSSITWPEHKDDTFNHLLTIDPTYQVWIDWYNRRIEGHKAAFDIPGDSDRTEDKKILARLADATNKDFWDKGATYVNTTLQNWIDEARERVRPRDAPFVTDPLRQLDDELQSLIDEVREQVTTQGEESAPDPQNADVIQFRQTDTGQFDPDFSAGSDELLTDQAALDRHCAFVTTARDALSLCRGHNQIGHVAEHLIIVIDAAGDQPRTMRVDLLVARGERMVDDLRDAVNELQPDPEVALGNLREKRIVNVFNALIRDYTAMIKLDPALDRRQRLPHDEENTSAVSRQQALIFVNSSVTVGAITQSARDVIVEGARGLAEDGDVKDRKKWRFSETVRNLPRAMIGFLWQHRVGIVGSSVAGVSAVSMALITQEAAIRSFFATNPGMLSIIDELVGILRGIGM